MDVGKMIHEHKWVDLFLVLVQRTLMQTKYCIVNK